MAAVSPKINASIIAMAREIQPVMWRSLRYEIPHGRLLAIRTVHGVFLHSMLDKETGEIVPWHEQPERWSDGRFDYDGDLEWVRLA